MPVENEFSIVADSTISSSPSREQEERGDYDASPPQIKRPTRTYGRRQEVSLVEEAEAPSSLSSSCSSRGSIHNTAPPGLSEEVPPSSPRTQLTNFDETENSDEDAGETSSAPVKDYFGWRAKLREVDEAEDVDVDMDSSTPTDNGAFKGFGDAVLLRELSSGSKSTLSAEGQSTYPLPSVSNDLFGEDSLLQEEQSSSRVPPARDAFVLSAPRVAPPARTRPSKVIHDSDSEPEPSKGSSSTSPSSSQPIHNIITPKSRSLSTTPPTSDDELPMKILGKSRSTGKRKATGYSRPSVPPLDLVEGPLSEPRTRINKSKVKALTKQEQAEMLKERTRIAASSNASIARVTVSKYTKEGLFAQLRDLNKQQTSKKVNAVPASDPIEAYSSPPGKLRIEKNAQSSSTSHIVRANIPKVQPIPALNDSDSEDLPEVLDMIKSAGTSKKEELRKLKQRALEHQQATYPSAAHNLDSDDDGLEIVNPNPKTEVKEEENRRSAKKSRLSTIRKQQLQLAHVNLTKQKRNDAASLLTVHRATEGSAVVLRQSDRLDQVELSRVLALQAQKEARSLTKKKADEWQKYGGRVAAAPENPVEGLATMMKIIAEKGLKMVEARASNRMDVADDEDDEEEDEDWDPAMRGSASPEPTGEADGESEEENDENMPVEEEVKTANSDAEEDTVEDSKVRSTRRMVITSDSEGENDENTPVAATLFKPNRQRRATSSAEIATDEENDKENNNDLMYDQSDDKENTAVIRHPLGARASRSIFDITASASSDELLRDRDIGTARSSLEHENDESSRRPFKELLSDASPVSSQLQSSNLTQSFATQLQQASPVPNSLAPAPTLKSFLGSGSAGSKSFSGFSQFSESGSLDTFEAAPLLQSSFSDLFESGTGKGNSPVRVNKGSVGANDEDFFKNSSRKLKRTDTLDLTQDVSALIELQPALNVEEGLLRKADAIFEKEQAFVVEAALQKPTQKPELYINDHGFLTQTKPADGTPEVYRPSPSQPTYANNTSMLSPSEFRSRAPLRTLSISSTYQPESPEQHPLRRLRKIASPTQGSDTALSSPSTTPPPKQNAFDLLAWGAAKAQRREEAKQKLPGINISEFLENEAAESDDDDHAFGYVKRSGGDDEEAEDLDQTLHELMDDKEMDESVVAADLVLEKYKEQEQEHDQKVQELHEAAVSGRLRLKRTHGVGVDDSDEESDDDGNERARRAMKKLRTTDRGDIQQLAANEATEAFAAVYNQSLKDDDDFEYMNTESNLDDLLADNHDMDEGADGYEDDEEEEQETISPQEITRLARQMKEAQEAQMDPEDVSWLDKDAEEAPMVKTVRTRQRAQVAQQDMDSLDVDGIMGPPFGRPTEQLNASSKHWYAQENKSRNAGTSRSVGGSAITGHAKAKSKTAAATGRPEVHRTRTKSSTASISSRPVKAERSMLSAITDKSRHFA